MNMSSLTLGSLLLLNFMITGSAYADHKHKHHHHPKKLEAPVLVSPEANSEQTLPAAISYQWQASENATHYNFRLFNAATRESLFRERRIPASSACAENDSGITLCTFTPEVALTEGQYFWRVRAINTQKRRYSKRRSQNVRSEFSVIEEVVMNQTPVAYDGITSTYTGFVAIPALVATDGDYDSLTYTIASLPESGTLSTADGTLLAVDTQVNPDTLRYTPNEGAEGDDSFTFTASDGLDTSEAATVSIVVGRYNKLNNEGGLLLTNAENWSCVRDNSTSLIWENKTDDGDLHDKDNTYSWYNGIQGVENEGLNTQAFTASVNALTFCGKSDWRLPSAFDFRPIAGVGESDIGELYFPYTFNSVYWSSSTIGPDQAVGVGFNSFYSSTGIYNLPRPMSTTFSVRLVSGERIFN